LSANEGLLLAAGALSLLTFVGTLVTVPVVLARIQADYFLSARPPADRWSGRHPVIRLAVLVTKNALGAILVLIGVVQLVLPGQGILTILIGIALLNFPGKRRLERAIASQPNVRRAIDWVRARAGRPPLLFDGD